MPCLTDLAPDLTVVEMEDADTVDRSEDCDDFVEDFVDIKDSGKKKREILLTFILCSQIPMRCSFSSTPVGLHGTMRTKLREAAGLVRLICIHNEHKQTYKQTIHVTQRYAHFQISGSQSISKSKCIE